MNTELMIHGHSCCEVKRGNISIICDPWLVGTAYWRSWFNFPEPPDYEKLFKRWRKQANIYFYITHLHWDHFHGPTIKKIIKTFPNNYKFLIPKTPEKRLKEDLESIVDKKNIFELVHARKYKLKQDFSILSFQSGPFFADSVLSIFSKEFSLLNLNDSKIFSLSMSHLLSLVPKPNYVLRSHSSANDRSCFRELDGKDADKKFDKSRLDYSKEFFEVCQSTKADYAIPFASNMACLHKETFKYNKILNFSDFVINDFRNLSQYYGNMDCKLLLPTEKIILETNKQKINKKLREELSDINRESYLISYQENMSEVLNKQYIIESKTKLNTKSINNYFSKIIKSTPLILKKYLGNYIYIKVKSKKGIDIFNINFNKNQIKFCSFIPPNKKNVIIHIHPFVINDICLKSHWNSIGVSKRLEVWMSPKNKRYVIFNLLCNVIEVTGFLPIKNIFRKRFFFTWIKRYREIIDLLILSINIFLLNKKSYIHKKS